jgi:hypothetical protein
LTIRIRLRQKKTIKGREDESRMAQVLAPVGVATGLHGARFRAIDTSGRQLGYPPKATFPDLLRLRRHSAARQLSAHQVEVEQKMPRSDRTSTFAR